MGSPNGMDETRHRDRTIEDPSPRTSVQPNAVCGHPTSTHGIGTDPTDGIAASIVPRAYATWPRHPVWYSTRSIHPSNEHQPSRKWRGDLHPRRLLQTHVPHPRGNEAQQRQTHPPRPRRSSTRTHTRSNRRKNKQTRIAPDTKTSRSKTPAKTIGSKPRRSKQTQPKKTSVELAPKYPPSTQPKDNNEEIQERRKREKRSEEARWPFRKTETPAVVRPGKRRKSRTGERQPRGRTSSQGREER